LPWRIKNFFSNYFPYLYHKIINLGIAVNSEEYWDEIYLREWDSLKRVWPTKNKLLKEKIQVTDAVLDIACGTGSILRYLKENGYNDLYGTEISDLCVKRLENLGIFMTKSLLPKIEYQDDSFDSVIASQILEHIVKRGDFMREIKRVMKPQGQCFLFVPDDCLGPIDEPSHVVKFNHNTLAKLIGRYFHDFTIKSIKDENFEIPILYVHIQGKEGPSP